MGIESKINSRKTKIMLDESPDMFWPIMVAIALTAAIGYMVVVALLNKQE